MGKILIVCTGLALGWGLAFALLVTTLITVPRRLATEPDVGSEILLNAGIAGLVWLVFFGNTLLTALVIARCYCKSRTANFNPDRQSV